MKTFEELPVWQAARTLVRDSYSVTSVVPVSRDAGLCDQIQRAAVSVASTLAEGHERGSTQELVQFLFYAKGSAGEVRSQLYHAEDLGYVPARRAEDLRLFAADIGRQLSAWIQSMQTPGFRGGPRYHKEPDGGFDRFLRKAGMSRMENGRIVETADAGRKTENGTRKTEDGGRG
jgi:four helix bundle protein